MITVSTEVNWPYTGNLEELYNFLYKRIEFKKVTLKMTQNDYNEFLEDSCEDSNIYAAHFRPLKIECDEITEWLFAGKLKLIIEIQK